MYIVYPMLVYMGSSPSDKNKDWMVLNLSFKMGASTVGDMKYNKPK